MSDLRKKDSLFALAKGNWISFWSIFSIIFLILIVLIFAFKLAPFEFRSQEEFITQKEYVDPQGINRIKINSVGIDAVVYHPQTREISVLDQFLTKGAVYYPGSGSPSDGNVFIFGHSTNWPVVRNQAYKTFNNLEDTKIGDLIELISADGKTYKYEVINVKTVDDNEAFVNFDTSNPMLTISTCNTFGQKQERNVVEAKLIE